MEVSDSQRGRSILERLDKIEHDIEDLRLQLASRDSAGTSMIQDRGAPRVAPYWQIPVANQIFCPNCGGGNPPDALHCLWCAKLMTQVRAHGEGPEAASAAWPTSGPLPAAIPQASAPLPLPYRPIPSSVQQAVEVPALEEPAVVAHNRAYIWHPVEARHVLAEQGVQLPAPLRSRPSSQVTLSRAAPAPEPARAIPEPPPTTGIEPEAAPRTQSLSFDFLKKSEFWLNKVGIGLLLLGLAFFFKYSIDRGWLTEPVRVALGLALGTVLLGFGLRLHRSRRHYSQVLLGGSIATYYITGYAAYELFALVPYEWAFGFMALVTALAFALAVRQDETILALIGVVGGLLTPFILTRPGGDAVGLVAYTCIVLAGTSAIYLYRGWRSLLWVGFVGGWLVFATGLLGRIIAGDASMSDRWALQAAALFVLVAYWGVPVLREALHERSPQRWPRPALEKRPELRDLVNVHVHVLVVIVPLMMLAYSWRVWGAMVIKAEWGWATLALAAMYGGAAWILRKALPQLAYTHTMMGILLLTLGVIQIFEGDALIFALAVEAAALLFVSRRVSDPGTAIAGNLLSALVALWLGERMLLRLFYPPTFTGADLTDLLVVVLLATASFAVWPEPARVLYRNIVHLAVMGWLFTTLYGIPYWSGLVMLSWAVYGIALYVAYLRLPARFGIVDAVLPSHAIFGAAAVLFVWRVSAGQVGDWSVFNLNTLIDAAFVAMLAGVSFFVAPRQVVAVYRVAASFGVLALLWRELWPLENGVSYVMMSWAVCGLALHYLATRPSDEIESRSLSLSANVAFAGVALWFVWGLMVSTPEPAVFNLPALISLACIGLAAGSSFLVRPQQAALAYWLGAYLAAMAWLWHELSPLTNGDGYAILAWAALATGLLYLARRVHRLSSLEKTTFTAVGCATFLLVGLFMGLRLISPVGSDTPVLNPAAATDLLVIGLAVVSAFLIPNIRVRRVFLLLSYIALLAWLWRELGAFENGNAYITTAWGACGIALLVAGLSNRSGEHNMPVVYAGTATLLLVVGKLFLIDLAALDPLWRVLLFVGFGGVFLLLSYYFQNVIRGKPGSGGRGAGKWPHWPGRPAH